MCAEEIGKRTIGTSRISFPFFIIGDSRIPFSAQYDVNSTATRCNTKDTAFQSPRLGDSNADARRFVDSCSVAMMNNYWVERHIFIALHQ